MFAPPFRRNNAITRASFDVFLGVRDTSAVVLPKAVRLTAGTFRRGASECAGDDWDAVVEDLRFARDFFPRELSLTTLRCIIFFFNGIRFSVGFNGIGAVTTANPAPDKTSREIDEPEKFIAVLDIVLTNARANFVCAGKIRLEPDSPSAKL